MQTRRNILKGFGAGAGLVAAASAEAAVWKPVSPSGMAGGNTWKQLTRDSNGAGKWNKVGRQQIPNCAGYLPNGYCGGNPKYIPPNGSWSTWGLGFTATNTYGYTGTLTNCSTVTVNPIYNGAGNWNYCNCGANCTFYYVNCNCNCNCANCANCTFCCFPKGTQVRLPDGSTKSIEQVERGQHLAALHGLSTVEDRVVCVVAPGSQVFRLNETVECTMEQLFLSVDGTWLAVSEPGYRAYRAKHRESNPAFGLADDLFRQMQVGDVIRTAEGDVPVTALEVREVAAQEEMYSFVMDGSRTFYANNYLVESRVSEDCFDLSAAA